MTTTLASLQKALEEYPERLQRTEAPGESRDSSKKARLKV
jgi:hypothetical protein